MNVETSFKKISYKEAIDFLLPRHYSGRKPQIKYAFGYFKDDSLDAVCTFGIPASRPLCVGVLGEKYFDKVIELNRLCKNETCEIPMSQFLSFCLKQLKPLNLVVVSYADSAMGHVGAVYQASNFIYTGVNKKRTDKYTEGNKHARHYDDKNTNMRKVRSAKHRYIYFCCDKRVKKLYTKLLKYKRLPYPKSDNSYYEFGYVLQPKIVYTNDLDFLN